MNAEILFILAALAVQTDSGQPIRFQTATPYFVAAMRGEDPETVEVARAQNAPGYESEPVPPGSTLATPGQTYSQPMDAAQAPQWNPFAVNQPYPSDPFNGPPPPDGTGAMGFGGGQFAFGVNGPQPYRLGQWTTRIDGGYLWSAKTSGVAGHFAVTEANAAARYSSLWPSGVIFSWTPEINSRSWQGPSGIGLPGQVWRAASDFELAFMSPQSPWSAQIGFTPAVAADFQETLTNKAYNFDGRGILFYRASPQLTLALGVVYFNRVKNYILPYAGIIWTPDDRWELRLMYPKTRISYFLGCPWGAPMWFYGSAEFDAESYQVEVTTSNTVDRIQLTDYRFAIGLRSEGTRFTTFVEGGYLVDRNVRWRGNNTPFSINDGPMVRAGVRW